MGRAAIQCSVVSALILALPWVAGCSSRRDEASGPAAEHDAASGAGSEGTSEEGRLRDPTFRKGFRGIAEEGDGRLVRIGFTRYQSWYPRGAASPRKEVLIVRMGQNASAVPLEPLRRFLEVYFAAPARVVRPVMMPPSAYSASRNQYDASALCRSLRRHVRRRSLAVVGITAEDLHYAEKGSILGLGSLVERVAVVSTSRIGADGPEGGAGRTSLLRPFKVTAHEVAHALGIPHCGSQPCIMNRAGTVAEVDAGPIHLCQDCLRKVWWRTGCDPLVRYRRLSGFYHGLGFAEADEFCRKRCRAVLPAAGD